MSLNSFREPGDEDLIVSFYMGDLLTFDEKPTGQKAEFIKINVPADRHNVIDTLVNENYIKRFKYDYENWKANIEAPKGTPIESWGELAMSQIQELKHMNIYFIEQLCKLTDAQVQRLGMGGMSLRKKAQDHLGLGVVEPEEVKALREQLAIQSEQIRILMESMNDAPRRGRPPKDELKAA